MFKNMDQIRYSLSNQNISETSFGKQQERAAFHTSSLRTVWDQHEAMPSQENNILQRVVFDGYTQKGGLPKFREQPGFVTRLNFSGLAGEKVKNSLSENESLYLNQPSSQYLPKTASKQHVRRSFAQPESTNSQISTQEYSLMKEVFSLFEHRNEGFIWKSDLSACLIELSDTINSNDFTFLLTELQKLGSKIEFSEFFSLFSIPVKPFSKIEDAFLAFELFDVNHTGTVSLDELSSINIELNYKAPVSHLQMMINSINSEGDGAVVLEDFFRAVKT